MRPRTVGVLLRLAPSVIALRSDRRKWISRKSTEADTERYRRHAERALRALLGLGPVYIKLGQWLSSRADILPQPYLDVLSRLQDDVPPAPYEQVRPVLEREIGPVSERLEEISPEAISGASLGQVYRARARGRDVVVKVRRPGIEDDVRRDLADLRSLLPLALRFIDPNLGITVRATFAQFAETVREELDYEVELANLKSIRSSTSSSDLVIVPEPLEDLCTGSVLTMTYVPGIKVTDIASLDRAGIDRQRLVVDIHRLFFLMLLRHPVFHADPHPGNLAVADDGRIVLYDYGMVGRLDPRTRLLLIRLYVALSDRSAPRAVRAMDDLGMLVPDYNRRVIERAIELSIQAMHGRRADELDVNILVELVNRTMGNFPFLLPKHLSLYMRMATLIEGIYKTHRVDFTFMSILREIISEEHLLKDAYAAELRAGAWRLVEAAGAMIDVAPELRRFLDDSRAPRAKRGYVAPGAAIASAVFAGSALVYALGDTSAGIIGLACSVGIMAAAAALGRR